MYLQSKSKHYFILKMESKKNLKKLPLWLGAINILFIIFFVLLYISETQIPTVFTSSGIVAIISAFIGVILTVFVTQILLDRQSESQAFLQKEQCVAQQKLQEDLQKQKAEHERKKEIDTKIFEEKLKTYQTFLAKLCEIVKQEGEDKDIEESEIKELIFQISLVRMHTKGERVEKLFKAISKIITNINSKDNQELKIIELTKHILSVIEILQEELYAEDEIGYLSPENIENIEKSIKDLSTDIVGIMRNTETVELEKTEGAEEITKRFQNQLKEALEKALKEKVSNPDDYSIVTNGIETPSVRVTNNEWDKYGFYIGLCYDNVDKLYFNIYGADENGSDYRDMYLKMRRKWDGNFNKRNWYMRLKRPYNKWLETDKGREAFSNPDDKLLSYICDLFTRSIEYLAKFRTVIDLRDTLAELNNQPNRILENNCLVHDFKFNDNGIEQELAVYTAISGSQWTVTLSENCKLVHKLFEKYNSQAFDINADLADIADYLNRLLKEIDTETNNNR